MWAEARKQERKIRGIMVDHKKRAERRREYYEKIVSIQSRHFYFHLIKLKKSFTETRSCPIFANSWAILQTAHRP